MNPKKQYIVLGCPRSTFWDIPKFAFSVGEQDL